jgi:ribosome biogenesis GTPase
MPTSRVIVCHGKSALLEHEGKIIACVLKGRSGRPVCGDLVEYQAPENEQPRINKVGERNNTLIRADFRKRGRIIASNIDQLVMVVAATPEPDWGQVIRGIVIARLCNISSLLLVNKTDLAGSTAYQEIEGIFSYLGCETLYCSATEDVGIDAVVEALTGRHSVLVGQSGVGKSTLSNRILPDREIRIGAISEATGFGRHTTTETTWYPLPNDAGAIIDSPGMRDFAIWDMPKDELLAVFSELAALAHNCRFNNCIHTAEPDCAVKAAVESGAIPQLWYQTWVDALTPSE